MLPAGERVSLPRLQGAVASCIGRPLSRAESARLATAFGSSGSGSDTATVSRENVGDVLLRWQQEQGEGRDVYERKRKEREKMKHTSVTY